MAQIFTDSPKGKKQQLTCVWLSNFKFFGKCSHGQPIWDYLLTSQSWMYFHQGVMPWKKQPKQLYWICLKYIEDEICCSGLEIIDLIRLVSPPRHAELLLSNMRLHTVDLFFLTDALLLYFYWTFDWIQLSAWHQQRYFCILHKKLN